MNNEYIYKDGKVLIRDENDNQTIVDYYDNLDKVLVQENLIELIELELQKIEKELIKYKNMIHNNKLSKILHILSPFLIMTFLPLICAPIISNLMGVNEIISTIYGPIKLGNLVGIYFSAAFSIPSMLMSLMWYLKEKSLTKEKNGKEVQYDYLKKLLNSEKDHLKQLKANRINNSENRDFYISKIDNKEILKLLKNYLLFYYDLGYNEQKYFKYYQQDILEKKFHTDEISMKLVNEHFEEKSQKLTKIKK